MQRDQKSLDRYKKFQQEWIENIDKLENGRKKFNEKGLNKNYMANIR